jgi:hypothetical protein
MNQHLARQEWTGWRSQRTHSNIPAGPTVYQIGTTPDNGPPTNRPAQIRQAAQPLRRRKIPKQVAVSQSE